MPRMIFIEPKAPNLHIFTQFQLPRLGNYILATLLRNKGWEVDVWNEALGALDYDQLHGTDMVGISTITSTAPRAYAMADRIRAMGIAVIMGGPHVTFLAEEALAHADFVIRGEGEVALSAFVDQWQGERQWAQVPGLSYEKRGVIIHNTQAAAVEDLDTLPHPDPALILRDVRSVAGHKVIPVQTSRGCPFDCAFCSVTGMFGRRYRFRSTEHILEELRQYDHPKHTLFFYDDNFTAHPARAKALLRAMIAEGFKFQWSTQVRVDVARDEELMALMKEAGCHTVYIGFESVNPESLKAMKKGQDLDEIKTCIRLLKRRGIHIHGMFVYGFDEDNWATVKETVRFARKARLTSAQFLILTPLPGSETFETLNRQGRIQFRDWNLYDAHHAVFQPMGFSLAELQRAQIFSHARFYSKKESLLRMCRLNVVHVAIARYARQINRLWKRKNRTFLKALDLLKTPGPVSITLDYREQVEL